MEKNYNYNYVNRSQGQKLPATYSNLGVSSCTAKVLKKCPVTNGSLWHTIDTNEFYYDWDGKRTKLNLTGDSAAISAEIAKIKADVAKLDPAAIESKINAATSKAQSAVSRAEAAVESVNGIKAEVNEAKEQADAAAQAAQAVVADVQDAVAAVENKADKQYVDDAIAAIELTPGPKGDKGDAFTYDDFTPEQLAALKGADGKDGVDGQNGKDGVDGQNGQDGKDGVDGKDGKDGENGKSAFEIAVEGGYVGTEAQWIESLKGANGKDGKDGADGQNGADGKDGATPEIGDNGNWFINGTDTGVKAAGVNGVDGQNGVDGTDGKDGKSAYDIAKENGFEGTEEDWLASLKGEGLSQEDKDLLEELRELGASDFETGTFPSGQDVDDTTAPSDGLTTVQDVIDYVNAFFEKKKDELGPVEPGTPYAYITGYALDGTPTDIMMFNPFELNESGDTELEIWSAKEIGSYDENGNDLPSLKLTVDIPSDYSIKESYQWNPINNTYALIENGLFEQNPRYATRTINGVTYNSYVRKVSDPYSVRDNTRYKIIITK